MLAACSGSDSEDSEPLSVPSAATASAEKSPKHQAQESLKKGQEVVVKDSGDKMVYRFKVNSAESVSECPNADYEGAPKPENGHLIQLNIEEQIGDLASSKDSYIASSEKFGSGVNQASWSFVGENGTRANEIMTPITYNCFKSGTETLPNSLKGKEQATGAMLLDLPETTGKLTYADSYSGEAFTWKIEDLIDPGS